MESRIKLESLKKIVIKLGTQVVADQNLVFQREKIKEIVSDCALLHKAGKNVLIVTSGAVGLGRSALAYTAPLTMIQKQSCAAVGQAELMEHYRALFKDHAITVAQVLLTADDFSEREKYLRLKEVIESLLNQRVIPIVNENDTISTVELKEMQGEDWKSFGDNDKLSTLVASLIDADLLVMLTNVDGLYSDNPETNRAATKISEVTTFDELANLRTKGASLFGRGGMRSKIEAAWCASLSGVPVIISSGKVQEPIARLFIDQNAGTFIHPNDALQAKERWIRFAGGYAGVVTINKCATKALEFEHASLLPVGIVQVEGSFSSGQIVAIQDEDRVEIGRGIVKVDAEDLGKIIGKRSEEIFTLYGDLYPTEIIHRDYMVLIRGYD